MIRGRKKTDDEKDFIFRIIKTIKYRKFLAIEITVKVLYLKIFGQN